MTQNTASGERKVFVCLRIGGWRSCAAYGLPGLDPVVMVNTKHGSAKAKTDVLLKRRKVGNLKWEVACFGDKAFSRGEFKADDNDYVFLASFHLILAGNDLAEDPGFMTKGGGFLSAVDVFAAVMSYWKTCIIIDLGSLLVVQCMDKDINWILTVPPFWSVKAKAIFRLAATKAGLCTDGEQDQQCIIVSELEAASLVVRQQLMFVDSALFQGKRVAVVDFDGWTTDMVVHEVKDDGLRVQDVTPAAGISAGGNLVNEEFVKFLEELVGAKKVKEFKEGDPYEFNDLVWDHFEQRKLEMYENSRVRFPRGLIPRGATLNGLVHEYHSRRSVPCEGLSKWTCIIFFVFHAPKFVISDTCIACRPLSSRK
eukprot:gb/GEZN01006909.1/.p1 GENE.gb/GEZN01006909.1/~~gb/GEZN01006909.1/.p1  ORF type:complete len:368 (+),score=27.08 gb/GEZN01006909.1/:113-1216(+)